MARATEKELLYFRKAFAVMKAGGEYPPDMQYNELSFKEKQHVRKKGRALLFQDSLA